MKILVTGVAGAIGSHMAETLAERGHDVFGIDCLTDYYDRAIKEVNLAEVQKKGVKVFRYDLAQDDFSTILPGTEMIFHFAAQPGISATTSFQLYIRNNVTATQRLLEEAKKIQGLKLFVHISTSSVYGAHISGDESEVPKPTSYYGVTKLAAEQMALAYHREYSMPVTVLRIFSVYGERERPEKLYHKLIRAIFEDTEFPLHEGSDKHKRTFTYVGDVIEGCLKVLEKSEASVGEIFNIGGGETITTEDGIAIIEDIIGKKAKLKIVPKRPGDQVHASANFVKAERVLEYRPRTTVREGLKKQVRWYRENIHGKIRPTTGRTRTYVTVATGSFGGPVTYSKLLADKLPADTHSVEVVPFGRKVVGYPWKFFYSGAYFFRLLLKSFSADIIYAQDPVTTGFQAMLVSKLLRKRFFLKIVGDYAWEQGQQRFGITDFLDTFSKKTHGYALPVRFFKWIQTMVANSAEKIIVPSLYLKGVVGNWGVNADKVVVIYNAVEVRVREDRELLRKQLQFSSPTIVSAGRLVPWKGFPTLIEAFALLKKDFPRAS